MKWKKPPVIKIYEALGAVVDGRVAVEGNSGKVYSSSRGKFYEVSYDPEAGKIMANDNGSYWKGYLGYPSIAFLMKKGVLSCDEDMANLLKGIAWKDINQKYKNDFDETLNHILSPLTPADRDSLESFASKVEGEIESLDLGLLGNRTKPPEGY